MTAPAPRNHPAEDAHPAPTPAPVAVPERVVSTALAAFTGSYGKGLREMLRDALTAALELWPENAPRPETVVACAGHATCNAPVHEHGCYNDYGSCNSPEEHRPEPVVAPLPSEAEEAAWCEFRDGPDYQPTDRYDVRSVFEAGFAAGRLVPEDDEDTVRVRPTSNDPQTAQNFDDEDTVRVALADLVRLKEEPHDDAYRAEKEATWQAVRDALGGRVDEDTVRVDMARAWEKGYTAGWGDCGNTDVGDPSDTPNPYRAADPS